MLLGIEEEITSEPEPDDFNLTTRWFFPGTLVFSTNKTDSHV
jgi:hypothetical protein